MNIPRFRFILFCLKIFGETVTSYLTLADILVRQFCVQSSKKAWFTACTMATLCIMLAIQAHATSSIATRDIKIKVETAFVSVAVAVTT